MTEVLFLHPVSLDGRAAAWLGLEDVVAPAFPGHGGRLRTPGVTLDEVADEVAAATDRPMHVVGASLGGMLALHLALRHPEKVASLALCFTTARVTPNTMLQRAELTERRGSAAMTQPTMERWFSPEALATEDTRPGVRYARERLRTTSAGAIADAWRAIAGHDVLDRLPGLDVPTTCIAGTRDESTPLPAMRATAEAIPGALLVEVDEPHMGFLEEPDEFSAVLRTHLDRVRS
jgi:3-oxoadipate enol-lactonase